MQDISELYYIHGYLSSPDSTKGTILKQKLGVKPIKYRDCRPEELVIQECIENIKKEIKDDRNPVLIGSSLGGFLSAKIALDEPRIKNLILLNPAILPADYDITKIKDMPQGILKDMIEPRFFKEKINAEISILRGTRDELLPNRWVIDFAKKQEAFVKFLDDDHSLSKNIQRISKYVEYFTTKH